MSQRSASGTVGEVTRTGCVILSTLLLSVSILLLAWRSYSATDVVHIGTDESEVMIASSRGWIQVVHFRTITGSEFPPSPRRWTHEVQHPPTTLEWLWPLGFGRPKTWWFSPGETMTQTSIVTTPDLLVSGVLLIPAGAWMARRHRRRRRVRQGRCGNCGYNITMSGLNCPECGTPLADAK